MQNYNDRQMIWQVVDSRAFGGIESHILYLSSALIEKGRNVCVVFINDFGAHPLEAKLQEQGIHFIKCCGAIDFIKLASLYRPRVIHSHGYKANLASRLAGKLYGIPIISSFHAGDCETRRLKLYTFLDRSTAFMGQAIAVNEQISRTLTGKPKVIDNFVPLPVKHKVAWRIQNIGFVGRLSHEKGPDRFIDLARRSPNLNFHVFGDGPVREYLKRIATKNVKFHGHVQSMESVWKDIDLLCMPSRREGLPMAALEAMAHGVPVLAYGVGALPKLIRHRKNGWLVDLPDDQQICVSDMEVIVHSLTNSEVRSCSINARKKIEEEHSTQALIPQFLKLYDDVAARYSHQEKSPVYAAP